MSEEWDLLCKFLPPDWESLAKETGAMRRARGEITSASLLLRLLLLHVATGLSLKQAAARAQVLDLVRVSDVALFKRLRSSEPWLREMTRRMFESSRFARLRARAPAGMRLRAVDATVVSEPGSSGTDWRVHFCVSLPEMRCDFYDVTDHTGAESLARLPIHKGDLILADRGYSHREGAAYVLSQNGHFVIRLGSRTFPLVHPRKTTPFDLLSHFRHIPKHHPGEWAVRFKGGGRLCTARLCAIRKSKIAAERDKLRTLRRAAKEKKKLLPDTLELAEYVYVLTSVEAAVLAPAEVLDLYRARWQIELCFKRLKSLLKLGHVPKSTDLSARAWIQGKLLTALLIEELVAEASLFSPWGFPSQASQPLA